MTSHEYAAAMSRALAIKHPLERYREWRRVKSARQAYLTRKRREADPDWWAKKLAAGNEYRRNRAAADPAYRARRNAQAH